LLSDCLVKGQSTAVTTLGGQHYLPPGDPQTINILHNVFAEVLKEKFSSRVDPVGMITQH
jgi:hypothetical protein